MGERFWYFLAGIVFVLANIALWLNLRRCKARGIKPRPPFEKLAKRFVRNEKRISKWSDYFIITFVLLCGIFFYSILNLFKSEGLLGIHPESGQEAKRLFLSVDLLLLLNYFTYSAILVSLLSPFHKNITLRKRIILVVISCVPITFGVLYWHFDEIHDHRYNFMLLLGFIVPVLLVNFPAILLGRSCGELYPRLLCKIPLPFFHVQGSEDSK